VMKNQVRQFMLIAILVAVFFATAAGAKAQSAFVPEAVSISGGIFNFDLSGTGTTPSLAVTADWPVTARLLIEGGATFARPDQQIGRTTYIIPEAQLQYRWQLGRLMPFVGGGVGAGIDVRNKLLGGTQVDLALSTGGGLRAKITESFGIRGDARLRGFGRSFSGSAAELRAGLFWTF
jgi:hypothetical protein